MPPQGPPSEELIRARMKADSQDPWPHYDMARLQEERQNYEKAILEYGEAINRLPPRSATRVVLALGVLHHRMGNPEPASRCYEEVLSTIASDTGSYERNEDYKVAALGQKALIERAGGREEDLRALEERFVDEFGGSAEAWSEGPVWITPLPTRPKEPPLVDPQRPATRPGERQDQ